MANYLQIQISNDMGLSAGDTLYVYIIGEVAVPESKNYNYYSYQLSTDGNFVATQGADNTVYPIAWSSLGTVAGNAAISYFNFDQSQPFSGRIWFSTSPTLLTIALLQVDQPNPSGGSLFDFAELTINAGSGVNCDTTQVVGLGIPITIVNPAVLPFPPGSDTAQYTYPNAIGIVPGTSLSTICSNFTSYINAIGLSAFSPCVASYAGSSGNVQWLMNPGQLVPVYDAQQSPQGLSDCMDDMVYQFFNYYTTSGNALSITFDGVVYTGTTVTQAGLDTGAPVQEYCALLFLDPEQNQYPVFYPYFNTNSASTQGGSLNPNGALPPPPSWWSTQGLASNIPASGQLFLCAGVFNDGNPNVSSPVILAALQNIVVTLLNRGVVPGSTMNNLFACTGQLSLDVAPVDFTDTDPASASTISGAALLYTPTQIPPNTAPGTCSVSGSIELSGGPTQQFTNNQITLPDPLPPNNGNYCNSVTLQLIPDPENSANQLVQFVFQYVNAVWPNSIAPALAGNVTGTWVPTVQTAQTATFTGTGAGTGFPSGIQAQMNVLDVNVQNPSMVTQAGSSTLTLQTTINGILPSPNTDTLIIGNFYPVVSQAASGCWNAYAAYLHYGGNGTAAPYISNQGYAFAYDDDGGYSSDVTVQFPQSGNCALGIYLGPLS